ncbi:hypothetical protein Ddye_009344 [Dipteronia dyeriana]|uniref:Uncharacterized protein n=1 Tax=Dipteronia dyeriana TaxID=168575 RepID=A0AAE0CM60_9ROSI|nr:hypothetical protein Ddye_009344 [Dipteronia dyeriana]
MVADPLCIYVFLHRLSSFSYKIICLSGSSAVSINPTKLYFNFPAIQHFIYRDTLTEDVDSLTFSLSCMSLVSDTMIANLATSDNYDPERLRSMRESYLA